MVKAPRARELWLVVLGHEQYHNDGVPRCRVVCQQKVRTNLGMLHVVMNQLF